MLQRVLIMMEEIAIFFENKNIIVTEIHNQEWISNVAFLVDLISHSDSLNLQLQEKLQLIREM